MSFQSANQANGSNNREAKGFLFLIGLLILPFLGQYTYRSIFYEPKQADLASIVYLTDSCEEYTPFKKYKEVPKQYNTNKKSSFSKGNGIVSIDINTADTILLKSLPGIGSVYALRIVKYRNLLGGFIEIEQLKEVYGIKNELFEQIKPLISIQTKQIKKIKADSLWYKPYAFYHPYLSKELKSSIQAESRKNPYLANRFKEMIEENNEKLVLYIVWE